jgi:ribonuclease P protein component
MLPQAERLRKTGLFQRVYSEKKSISSELVTLYVLERQPRSSLKSPLVGFVIGKKVQAKATGRNRAKRRVREAYRLHREELLLAGGEPARKLQQWYSLVWNIRNEAINAPFAEIRRCVGECLSKATEKFGRKGIKSQSG